MKKVLSLVLILYLSNGLFAASDMSGEKVNGPVKQITKTFSTSSAKWITWFDEQRRETEKVFITIRGEQSGHVSQYLPDNIRMDYNYDKNGIVEGSYCRNLLDSMGNCLLSQRYNNGKLVSIDSIVYNERGLRIENHEYLLNTNIWTLKSKCEYDSLNRLIKEYKFYYKNPEDYRESVTTIEYFPNGNYTKHIITVDKKEYETKYIVNKKGLVTKIVEPTGQTHISYKKFDKYDNWLKKTETFTGYPIESTKTTERTIEYYE